MELEVTQSVQQSGSLRRPVAPLQTEMEMAFRQAGDWTIQQEKVAGAKDLTTQKRSKASHEKTTVRVKRTPKDLEIKEVV